VGGGTAVLAGFLVDFPPRVTNLKGWGIIIYTGTLNVALGLTVWNHVLRTLRSYEASILGASTIIWSTLLAMIILGEKVELHQWLGMGTMLFGLVLVQTRVGHIEVLFSSRRATRAE
jgi:drug/metabolite transporter (DMT)-like permease